MKAPSDHEAATHARRRDISFAWLPVRGADGDLRWLQRIDVEREAYFNADWEPRWRTRRIALPKALLKRKRR